MRERINRDIHKRDEGGGRNNNKKKPDEGGRCVRATQLKMRGGHVCQI